MTKIKGISGKLVYCMLADTESWDNNKFRSSRFLTGMVFSDRMEEISAYDLEAGDLIHFRPGMDHMQGYLSVVDTVDTLGIVHLGNIVISQDQLKQINALHLAGKL